MAKIGKHPAGKNNYYIIHLDYLVLCGKGIALQREWSGRTFKTRLLKNQIKG